MMAIKTSKKLNSLKKAKGIVKKVNNDLIDASFQAIEASVKAGERWQKLTKKMIKKAEPLSKQQMNMFVETAETLKEQVETSTDRLKDLVGYDPKMLDQAKAMVANHPVVEKADAIKQKIESEVAKNKFVKKAEKMSNKFRNDITKTIDEVKNKIEDYAEDVVEDIQEKVDDFIGTKEVVTKKESTKKTVAKKVVVKKASAKNTTTEVALPKSEVKNDLKVIKGIGPKLEETLNSIGIIAYEQLAKITLKDLRVLLTKAGVNHKMYDLSGWKKQAKAALKA